MALKYETSVVTLVQFITLAVLNFVNGVVSGFQGCAAKGGDCVGNIFSSTIYFLIIAGWFGLIWVLGFTAQDRRSKRLARLLIVIEASVALVALFDARHYPNILGLVTSLLDCGLALWVIILAFRLMRANGGRIVASPNQQRHRRPKRQ